MSSFKNNFIFPIAVLSIIFTLLTMHSISIRYTQNKSLQMLERGIEIGSYSAQLVHSLQKERGLSAGYVSTGGKQLKKEMIVQRKITDKLYKQLKEKVPNGYFLNNKNFKNGFILCDKLDTIRFKIDNLQISTTKLIEYYSKINKSMSLILLQITQLAGKAKIRKQIFTYYQFLSMKEYAGIERALGMQILAYKHITIDAKLAFYDKVAKQTLYETQFLYFALPKVKKYYFKLMNSECIKNTQQMRNLILYTKYNAPIDLDIISWYNNMTQKIDRLAVVNSFLIDNLETMIQKKVSQTHVNMLFFLLLNLINITIFIYMIYMMLKIRKNEIKLKDILDKNIISSTTNTKGIITSVSSAFCQISGFSKEELIGKPHNIIRHPDMGKEIFKEIWRDLKNGKKWKGKLKNLKKDGGYYWVIANIEPLMDTKGKIYGYLAIRQDITSQIKLQEAIELNRQKDQQIFHQNRLAQMGEMISMIAHQWRQPLGAITARVGALILRIKLKHQIEPSMLHEELSKVNEYAQHLSSTINDFRGFFKENKEKENITLEDLVESTLNIVQTSLYNHNIKIVKNFNCNKIFATYSSELKQVILNLITNAEDILLEKKIKNPTITIDTIYDNNKNSYILQIKDNGNGVPKDIIDKIFDPYFSTKLEKDGTGLGLYMSKTIVEEHCKGKISVSNDNEGAVFKIELGEING